MSVPMGPEWVAWLAQQGLKPGMDVGKERLAELQQQYGQYQQANTQAPGVAKQLGRDFGPGQLTQDAAGNWQQGKKADPEAANMVGLMSDPTTRQAGLAGAMQMLAPKTTQQRAALEQDAAQYQQTFDQAGQQFQQRMTQDAEQFGKNYALDMQRTRATIANMSMSNAAQLSDYQLKAAQMGYNSENSLREQFQKNPLVQKTQLAGTSWQQLQNALAQNDPTALGSAIVAITQVQEPGLAVREDDRVRYSGSNPLITQLAQMANNAAQDGRIDPLIKQRMSALGVRLLAPHAANYFRIKSDYAALASGTPGAKWDRVVVGTGVDEATLHQVLQLSQGQ
jgi:hypothetical protein